MQHGKTGGVLPAMPRLLSRGLATGLAALAAAAGWAAPPLADSRYLNPVWPDPAVTNQAWWTHYTRTAGFAAIGGYASSNTAGPAAGAVQVADSSFGEPVVGVGANFQLGDTLTPPQGVDSNATPVLDFLGGPTNAVWLDYANRLIASDMGAVQVSWTLMNGTTQTLTYMVSPNPTRRPVRLYWTEGQNAGPTISFSTTYRVDIFYNSQIRGTNDVWIDANQLHASPSCGSGGRFLLTYSRVDEATSRRELLAYEVVEVLQPMSSIRRASVGERLLPQERPYPTDSLFPTVTRGLLDPAGLETPYVYQHTDGSKKGWIWAIRETAQDEAWRIEVYWKAKEELDVLWPFEVDIYHVTWGENAQRFVRAPGQAEPRVRFPDSIQVELLPHSKPLSHRPVLANGSFHSVDEGYCLLKYIAGDDIWFEAVRSIAHDNPLLAGPVQEWDIATEIRPFAASGSAETVYGEWPGYLYTDAGTAYNIGRYAYPSSAVAPAQAASYVFPVNTGRLDVWWSNRSRQDGLPDPIFFPSLPNRYRCVWPVRPRAITIASGLGNTGYTEDRDSWCIRFDREGMPLDEAQAYGSHLWLDNPNSLRMAGPLTLELWLKPDSRVGMQVLVDKGANYSLRLNGGVPEFYTGGRWHRSTARLAAGAWQHLAVSVTGGAVTFYLTGAESGSLPLAAPPVPGDAPLRVGARASDGVTPEDFYSGSLDELRIWAVARSRDEIRDNLSIAVDAGAPGLRARYRFDPGEQAFDTSTFGNHLPLPPAGTRFSQPGVPQTQEGVSLSGLPFTLYEQNDPARHGFNPNEEHAIVFQDTVYALRCDLNVTNGPDATSDPYVLLDFPGSPETGNRPAMMAFQVTPSNSLYSFTRYLEAGLMIQPPYPISLMQPANLSSNRQVAGPEFRDRNRSFWARQAGDTGGPTNAVLDFFYPMQTGFFFPGLADPPALGSQIAWLDRLSGDGTPLDFTYIIEWPADVPVLHIGDTLTVARDGLPAIRGQLSVDVPYQQSAALNPAAPSVTLIDPTVVRPAPLANPQQVTGTMKSYRDPRTANWHFSDLPPALRGRLFYNPNAQAGEELQLTGEYRTRSDNHHYLLLNLLGATERAAATNETAIGGIAGPAGAPWREGVDRLPATVVAVTTNTVPFDSLALPTTGLGTGYVTVVFNNSTNRDMVDPSEVVDMAVFRVDPELYRGRLDVIQSANPLDKQLNVFYTADFRGTPERWVFKWEYADPVNGQAPDEADATRWNDYLTATGAHFAIVGDAGVFGLSDHYLRCAYRPADPAVQAVAGTNWSPWTPPVLCEGWIKRVLKAINPFEQRIRDFLNYAVLTDLSMLQQIGAPYDGDIPLNLEALNEYGLAQIYETLNHQADQLSVDAGNEANGSLALALLMVKGRLSDLYMVLGHEAYGDALNPTLSLGADDPVGTGEAASLFSFQNQVPDLLSEELALLRGRDDSVNPSVTAYPLYNRLAWNLTADITGGQVAYMLNYGISDLKGDQNGVLDAADAAALYPQGHGDAYGHYLSALKGYYDYLHNPNFSWLPQVEGILVGDTEVTVSQLHEKKFATAAAARARAGVAVIRAVHRQAYDGPEGWRTVRDANTNRAWGVGDWSCRVGMGAYFDWLTANSLLPSTDPHNARDGIRIIDRAGVPELDELADLALQAERQADYADGGLNPLGLAHDAVPFDISSLEIDGGKTHFEQTCDRALAALHNALAIAERVRGCAGAIRDQNEQTDLDATIQAEEARINRELIALYGHPYADDIGPGKPYPQGYNGPDMLHYMYVDTWPLDSRILTNQRQLTLDFTQYHYDIRGQQVRLTANQSYISELFEGTSDIQSYGIQSAYLASSTVQRVQINVANNGIPVKPASFTGKRRAEGEIQMALSDYLAAIAGLQEAVNEAQQTGSDLWRRGNFWVQTMDYLVDRLNETMEAHDEIRTLSTVIKSLNAILELAKAMGEMSNHIKSAAVESLPTVVGMATDATAPARGSIKFTYASVSAYKLLAGVAIKGAVAGLETRIKDIETELERSLMAREIGNEGLQAQNEILSLVQRQGNHLATIQMQLQRTETARMRLMAAVSQGDQLQIERERLRMNWAADLNTRRYRNMAYRLFQNDELIRYQQAFDLAARYTWLAAKAYDYETGLLDPDASPASAALLRQVVKARALGRFAEWTDPNPGEPLVGGAAGDPGLADVMARLKANWSVLNGRLSFNNPQQETGRFSMRQELFRISTNAASDANWRATLTAHKVANLRDLPEFARLCLPMDPMRAVEPAIVIPFSSTVDFRRNFFGHLLAGGDNAYDSTHFATKIRSAGVWFGNYNSAFGGGLANQPRVYLVPAGADAMRVPLGSAARRRQWSVVDQALPLPYPVGDSEWEQPDWSMQAGPLGNELFRIRRHPSMLAYHDSGDADANLQVSWNSRLIGRSVWNTQWLLIIPGGTLLADANEGVERFINGAPLPSGARDGNGVKDIKIYFHTYSYSGN